MLDDLLNTGSSENSVYQSYASDSLIDIINMVVPEERNGIINLLSTLQVSSLSTLQLNWSIIDTRELENKKDIRYWLIK